MGGDTVLKPATWAILLLTLCVVIVASALTAAPAASATATPASPTTNTTTSSSSTSTRASTPTNMPRPTGTAPPTSTPAPTNSPTQVSGGADTNATATANAQLVAALVPQATQTSQALATAGAQAAATNAVATYIAQSALGQATATAAANATSAALAVATVGFSSLATDTPFPTDTPSPSVTATPSGTATPNLATPHDNRYFAQTGFRVDNDTIWAYCSARGAVPTFGFPTSRTFQFLGFQAQFFQRRVVQLGPDGSPRLLNLFDQGLFPYTTINGSTFPAPDPTVLRAAPQPGSPSYASDAIAFIKQRAPDSYGGQPTAFFRTFSDTVSASRAFPDGRGDLGLLPSFDLEMWGLVTSQPMADPANSNFIYLRFQRGIMQYDATSKVTQTVLLADYFKALIMGVNVPPDLVAQAQGSRFAGQHNDALPNGLNQPAQLPDTNLQFAFDPE